MQQLLFAWDQTWTVYLHERLTGIAGHWLGVGPRCTEETALGGERTKGKIWARHRVSLKVFSFQTAQSTNNPWTSHCRPVTGRDHSRFDDKPGLPVSDKLRLFFPKKQIILIRKVAILGERVVHGRGAGHFSTSSLLRCLPWHQTCIQGQDFADCLRGYVWPSDNNPRKWDGGKAPSESATRW